MSTCRMCTRRHNICGERTVLSMGGRMSLLPAFLGHQRWRVLCCTHMVVIVPEEVLLFKQRTRSRRLAGRVAAWVKRPSCLSLCLRKCLPQLRIRLRYKLSTLWRLARNTKSITCYPMMFCICVVLSTCAGPNPFMSCLTNTAVHLPTGIPN